MTTMEKTKNCLLESYELLKILLPPGIEITVLAIVLLFSQLMILINNYKENDKELIIYLGFISTITTIFVSRPKYKKSSKEKNYKHESLLVINFIITSCVHIEVLIFSIIIIISERYHTLTVYTGFISMVLGIYLSRPKIKLKEKKVDDISLQDDTHNLDESRTFLTEDDIESSATQSVEY